MLGRSPRWRFGALPGSVITGQHVPGTEGAAMSLVRRHPVIPLLLISAFSSHRRAGRVHRYATNGRPIRHENLCGPRPEAPPRRSSRARCCAGSTPATSRQVQYIHGVRHPARGDHSRRRTGQLAAAAERASSVVVEQRPQARCRYQRRLTTVHRTRCRSEQRSHRRGAVVRTNRSTAVPMRFTTTTTADRAEFSQLPDQRR